MANQSSIRTNLDGNINEVKGRLQGQNLVSRHLKMKLFKMNLGLELQSGVNSAINIIRILIITNGINSMNRE